MEVSGRGERAPAAVEKYLPATGFGHIRQSDRLGLASQEKRNRMCPPPAKRRKNTFYALHIRKNTVGIVFQLEKAHKSYSLRLLWRRSVMFFYTKTVAFFIIGV